MAEDLEPPHGDEAAEVGQQPDALVVDAHVEVDRSEAFVLSDATRTEKVTTQTTIASPSTTARGRPQRLSRPVRRR